jgi:hypothetical protein
MYIRSAHIDLSCADRLTRQQQAKHCNAWHPTPACNTLVEWCSYCLYFLDLKACIIDLHLPAHKTFYGLLLGPFQWNPDSRTKNAGKYVYATGKHQSNPFPLVPYPYLNARWWFSCCKSQHLFPLLQFCLLPLVEEQTSMWSRFTLSTHTAS